MVNFKKNVFLVVIICGVFFCRYNYAADSKKLIIPQNCSHAAFRTAELSLGEDIGKANADFSDENLGKPFLNSLHYTANLDARAYALACGDTYSAKINFSSADSGQRAHFKYVASQIVYMKHIVDKNNGKELFSDDSEFKKLLNLQKLHDTKFADYAIVINLSKDQNVWNTIVVKSQTKEIYGECDKDIKNNFVDLLGNTKKLEERMQESLLYHFSESMFLWHCNAIGLRKNITYYKVYFKQFFTVRIASLGLCICIVGTLMYELVKRGFVIALLRQLKFSA